MEFDLQPTLRGKLLEARPLLPTDFDALFAAASDPLVWEQHPEPTRHTKPVFQKFFDTAIESKGAFAVTDLASGRIVGSSRYYGHDPDERASFGYDRREHAILIGYTFFERACWGRSFNPELKAQMIGHAFKFVDRVYFEIGENNIRSQIAIQRVGARFFKKRQVPLFDGSLRPVAVFALNRT
jgi:RimJ/RimL family protein N-acetyltransferase